MPIQGLLPFRYETDPLTIGALSERQDWSIKNLLGDTSKIWDDGADGTDILYVSADTGGHQHNDLPSLVFNERFATARSPFDANGHGTHTQGTMCGLRNNAGYVGIAHGGSLGSIGILGDNGSNTTNRIAQGYRWLMNWWITEGHKHYIACVLNLSLGGGFDSETEGLLKDMNFMKANGILRPILPVAAIGNDGGQEHQERGGHPGTSIWTLGVAAHNIRNERAGFSSVSSKVDVSGPGENVTSTYLNNTFRAQSGSSMSSPAVAAASGLIIQCDPHNRELQTAAGMRAHWAQHSIDLGKPGKDKFTGVGKPDVKEAILDQEFFFG